MEPVLSSAPVRSASFWSSVKESILGTEQDFTEGDLGRGILLLSVPMILEMIMESLFGIVDIFFVASLGADAVATVGFTESLLTLVFAVAMGLSMASTATVARRIGEKDGEGAAVAAVQSIAIGLIVSAVVAAIGIWFAPWMLSMMGASASVIARGSTFTRVMLGGSGTIFMLFLVNAIFRGAGDAAIAMRTLWIANSINIVLNPCLIFGLGPFPQMGVTGSAVGTTIGRGIGVLFQLWILAGGRSRVVISRQQIKLDVDVMLRLIRLSLGGMIQYAVAVSSWLGLVRISAAFGSAAIAGYTLALKIVVFAILPSWGMSNAAATLVGQNLGAGKPERAEKSVWLAGFYNMIFLGLVEIGFLIFARPLIGLFTSDPAVVPVGVSCLRWVSSAYIFYAYGMVMEQAFNGAGDTTTPTIINLFCYWLWQIPLAYFLAFRAGLGATGVFIAIAISESTLAVVAMFAFRRGKWKHKRV